MITPTVLIAAVTLLILYTVTIIGGVTWLNSKFDTMKREILADFNKKHDSNNERYEALNTLVVRHDIILSPEFRGARHVKS